MPKPRRYTLPRFAESGHVSIVLNPDHSPRYPFEEPAGQVKSRPAANLMRGSDTTRLPVDRPAESYANSRGQFGKLPERIGELRQDSRCFPRRIDPVAIPIHNPTRCIARDHLQLRTADLNAKIHTSIKRMEHGLNGLYRTGGPGSTTDKN